MNMPANLTGGGHSPRVLIVTHHSLSHEGPQIRYLTELLCEQGAHVELLGPISPVYQPRGVMILRVKPGRFQNVLTVFHGAWRALWRKYDLLIGVDESGCAALVAASFLKPENNARTVLYFLDLFLGSEGSRCTAFGRWALRMRGHRVALVADTNEQRCELRREFLRVRGRHVAIHNAPPRSAPEAKTSGDSIYANCPARWIKILYTGGIHPAVQLDRAIEAIPLLKAPGMLYIVGPGQDEYVSSLKVLSTKLGCQGSVVFSGVVPRGRLRALASGADIGLAFYDNSSSATLNHRLCSPNKVYEYMAAGLPTVCSANATLVDLVEKRGWGFCADTSDIAAVARAIDRLASDAELRNEFKRNAGLLHQSEMNCEVQYAPIIALL